MTTKIAQHRVLVSGAGSIGVRHLKNLRALGVTDLAFADPGPPSEGLSALQQEGSLQAFTEYEKALSEFKPTIVFLCSPTAFHIAQATLAARAGCHLFIEKPLSHSPDGIDALLSECEAHHLVTMVGCNWRFHPGSQLIKKLLAEGAIGDVLSARIRTASFLPHWRRAVPYKESYSADPKQGGVLLDCIHEIDLALWYFGAASLEFASVLPATSIGLTVDGLAELLLRHTSGALSSVHLSFVQRTWRRGCEIIGSEGTIQWELKSPPGASPQEDAAAKVLLYGADGALRESFPVAADRDAPYKEEIRHFLDAVARGEETAAPLSQGVSALMIALGAKRKLVS
ncbi:hypothetical protein A2851_00415 [Candidatus Kaiserbacteria bacterium RIFCSPHIGHO2_01_FULL_53_29]|uniref:Gfo/Idh/MocA-like oxidoreductase N-terminal domain-containing protein n=1 Tax=Candidatus Kaiserbacteria bacterium RIFCSPHIGHO2_01_FULL_53_29 TaxID=1798480 RepID=A0A1F6CVG2_9BACT|nr:MAG: hypothetical protein A2851_00415 [Candidatus Kaiserbacteria bacterium RIFCSPHIGHO2_01_FULL_53_29]